MTWLIFSVFPSVFPGITVISYPPFRCLSLGLSCYSLYHFSFFIRLITFLFFPFPSHPSTVSHIILPLYFPSLLLNSSLTPSELSSLHPSFPISASPTPFPSLSPLLPSPSLPSFPLPPSPPHLKALGLPRLTAVSKLRN